MDRLLKDAMNTRLTQPVNCPDAEALAAWADGTIYGPEAEKIESHLADCERCQAVIAAFVATDPAPASAAVAEVEADSPAPVVPFPKRGPSLGWVPIAIGAIAASLVVWFAWPRPPASESAPTLTGAIARNDAPAPGAGRQEPPPNPVSSNASTAAPSRTAVIAPAPKATTAPATGTITARQAQGSASNAVAAPPPPMPPPLTQQKTADLQAMSQRSVPLGAAPAAAKADLASAETVSFIMKLPDGGVEFGPTNPVAEVTLTPTQTGVASTARNPLKAIRWRVLLSGVVEKTIDSGATWSRIVIDPALSITTGASPSNVVCWLAGKAGAVLRSTDGGKTFVKVTAPAAADLVAIQASDDRNATVSTSDGRRLTTTDGGQTWQR